MQQSPIHKVENLQKASPNYTLVCVPIASPLLMGVYLDGRLIEQSSHLEKTSDILLPMLEYYLERYSIDKVVYTRGPGSYMAIKIAFVMLKTLEIVRGIPCYGCLGFTFNDNAPIKAIGDLYFIKEKETIITKKISPPPKIDFQLPSTLDRLVLDKEATPLYILPAV